MSDPNKLSPSERQAVLDSLTQFDMAYILGVIEARDPELYAYVLSRVAARRAERAGDAVSSALDVEADASTRHDGGEA